MQGFESSKKFFSLRDLGEVPRSRHCRAVKVVTVTLAMPSQAGRGVGLCAVVPPGPALGGRSLKEGLVCILMSARGCQCPGGICLN